MKSIKDYFVRKKSPPEGSRVQAFQNLKQNKTMKRKTVVEFDGGEAKGEVHPTQLIPNGQLAKSIQEKELREYFLHCVGACEFPQRYKESEVEKLLNKKTEIAKINESKNEFYQEAAYRLEELHEEMVKPNNYRKSESKKTPMGED